MNKTKTANTPFETALIEEVQVIHSIQAVSAKWLASQTGIAIDRIYQLRNNRAKTTWAELQTIRRAIRDLSEAQNDN